jgi:histidinol dehydrogenase
MQYKNIQKMLRNAIEVLAQKGHKNAGEILIGEYTPFSLANFSIGPNAILPTGGFAKTFSPVSVRDFLKYSSIGYVTRNGFKKLKDYAIQLADYEGFPSHSAALKKRNNL